MQMISGYSLNGVALTATPKYLVDGDGPDLLLDPDGNPILDGDGT